MSSGGGESVGNAASDLANRIKGRFGVLPNFFRLGPETPEITEKLWDSRKLPTSTISLPSIFKERLYVHLALLRSPLLHCSSRWFLGGTRPPRWRRDRAYAKRCRRG
jgi:hypothetical protein